MSSESWGGPRQDSGRPRKFVQIPMSREEMKIFRDACEASECRTLTNGEFDQKLEEIFKQAVQAFIEAPKPEPKWTVALFWDGVHDGKELQRVADLSEEEALRFAAAHQNVEVGGHICNAIVAWQQGCRNNERRWKANETPKHLKF